MTILREKDLPKDAGQRRTEEVELASLGGSVLVRQLSLSEGLALEAAGKGQKTTLPHLLAAAVVDADGRSFWPAARWDLWAVQNVDEFKQLYRTALRLNGGPVSEEDAEDAEKKA